MTHQMSTSDEPFLIDGVNLVGWDVLEVGLRQAWPFLTFGSPENRTDDDSSSTPTSRSLTTRAASSKAPSWLASSL